MKKLILLFLVCGFSFSDAQTSTELVFVYFKDKPNKASFYANPLSELSQKSLDRRSHLGIELNDQDAPIENTYIQNIKNLGFTVTDSSKWLNGVSVNATPEQISTLASQPYVASVESFVKNPSGGKRTQSVDKFNNFNFSIQKTNFNYGNALAQTEQINLKTLHQQGYTGEGITIAMLDTGFPTVDTGSAYARLRNAGKIKGGYNFISKNDDIYNTSLNNHGAICLGAIVGYIENEFVGTAPDVNVYLYATEYGSEEIPEEELYWIEGAEQADRMGVDIISASLGYSTFDDSRYDYTYQDMTGSRSFVARGAQIATEKGIIVLAANGNEGNKDWHYLLTPADNAKVFSIGAVQESGQSSTFSSYGPNASGSVKPDASARGSAAASVYDNATISASGTSIATPIAAGGIACLLQSINNSTSRDVVRNQLRNTASLAPAYTDQMGYGILDFGKALNGLLAISESPYLKSIKIYPNPSNGVFTIESGEDGNFQILDQSGRKFFEGKYKKGKNKIQQKLNPGMYIIKTESTKHQYDTEKLIIK